jgi:hypothetical protein
MIVVGASLAAVAGAASSPSVTTGKPGKITSSTAVLNGTVNPNGAQTDYYFQWGLTSGYGTTGHLHSAGSGTKPVAAQAFATHLISGTVYHYRIVAQNKYGVAAGSDRMFKTTGFAPPQVAVGSPAAISSTSVTLTGVVSPQGAKTNWFFEYGLFPGVYFAQSLTSTTPAVASGVTVASNIGGLEPGTVFHYQLVAVHGSQPPVVSGDFDFMTLPAVRPKPRVRARTTPHRARTAPYVFATSGRLVLPASIPAQFGCSGDLLLRFLLGARTVGTPMFVPVNPDCTFAGRTTFTRRPGRAPKNRQVQLRLLIHYIGTGYLAPANARVEQVSLG